MSKPAAENPENEGFAFASDEVVNVKKSFNNTHGFIRIHATLAEQLRTNPTLNYGPKRIILEPEQIEPIRGIKALLDQGVSHQYVEAPTGFGKTTVILKLLETLAKGGFTPKVLIAIPEIDNITQWVDAIIKHRPALGARDEDLIDMIGYYFGEQKKLGRQITMSTFTSYVLGCERGVFKDDSFDLIIVDEGQDSLSELRSNRFTSARSVVIAMSATPDYSVDRGLDNYYTCAYSCPEEKAVDLRLIRPYTSIILPAPDVVLDDAVLEANGTFKPKQLQRALERAHVTQDFSVFYQAEAMPHNGKPFFGTQGLVSCVSIDDANDTANDINAFFKGMLPRGVKAAAASYSSATKNRDNVLADFHDQKYLMLTAVGMLLQAYDNPKLQWLFNKSPSTSGVHVGQRGGRPRRIDRDMPATTAQMAYIIEALYKNTSYKAYQLLYPEWVKGFVLPTEKKRTAPTTANENKNSAAKETKARPTLDLSALKRGVPVTDPTQIAAILESRSQELKGLRPAPPWAKRFPVLWNHMNRLNVTNAARLTREVNASSDAAYSNAIATNILSGKVKFFDVKLQQWHPFCADAAITLGVHVSHLFPIRDLDISRDANPDAVRREANRTRAMKFLKREGYETIREFADTFGLNMQRVHTVLSEGTANYGPQGWSSDSEIVAEALAADKESLYGKPRDALKMDFVLKNDVRATHINQILDMARKEGSQEVGPELAQATYQALMSLTPREERILRMQYGISASPSVYDKEATLEEIGNVFGVTRERIRQMGERALRKLKHPSRSRSLRQLLP